MPSSNSVRFIASGRKSGLSFLTAHRSVPTVAAAFAVFRGLSCTPSGPASILLARPIAVVRVDFHSSIRSPARLLAHVLVRSEEYFLAVVPQTGHQFLFPRIF